jgi:hypothetical protein
LRRVLAVFTAGLLLPAAALAQAAPTNPAPSATPGMSSAQGDAAAPPGPAWLPRGGAEVQALDKVNARSQKLRIRDGASATFGSLTIAVRACYVRPSDQPGDATARLAITDAHAGASPFRAWMFASDPAVSMLEHPIYDIRLLGCVP